MQTTPLNQVPITAQAYRTQPNNEAAQDGLYDYDDATDIVEDRESGSSEWSLSPVSESTSTSAFDSWLSAPPTPELKGHSAIGPVGKGTGGRSSLLLRRANRLGDRSYLGDAPEEILLHIISHLSAGDLLNVKLVSRRFNELVNSPQAWMNAFSRYFPGSEVLHSLADTSGSEYVSGITRSEQRHFTRLRPSMSWSAEYLLRTKLLRCLNRGKPSVPCAAPCPGRPGKGMATLTFGSRLPLGIDRLDAKFGLSLEKNFPRFIHGTSNNANVSSSDKRGKVDSWGLLARGLFQEFTDIYPEQMAWGQGAGEMVGTPNSMDVSQPYGSIFGSGMPGGPVYFFSVEEKRGRILDPFIHDFANATLGVPRMNVQTPCTSSVWIAKTPAIPTMTRGLIGMLAGTSSGIVTAYSLGMIGLPRGDKLGRGELTVRWMLSPGVPIIALYVDDNFSEERSHVTRIWAVALNALGEVFHMEDIPVTATTPQFDAYHDAWQTREVRAWQTGHDVAWKLVHSTIRQPRHVSDQGKEASWFPARVSDVDTSKSNLQLETKRLEILLQKRPIDIREDFFRFDMRRRLLVDFAGDDGRHGGESVLVVDCGYIEEVPAAVRRYTRCSFVDNRIDLVMRKSGTQQNSGEWRMSYLTLGRFKNVRVTASAMDQSKNATVTASEEPTTNKDRSRVDRHMDAIQVPDNTTQFSQFRVPGQRGRFFALGTAAGTVLVWDVRAAISTSSSLNNSVAPLRIIHTDSPEISCLALSSLYLVAGGSEGLVQAWDPLASTLAPVRTLSSRSTLNARRRAVIAESSDASLQNQFSVYHAAKAICLDPDPTVLRGVVAIGAHLRYWSYSSETTADEFNKSQKRRMRRSARGLNAMSGDNFPAARRVGLKSFVEGERHRRDLDEREAEADEREQARVSKRFGVDLLGYEASEEEMVAYATMLSEEDAENKQRQAFESHFAVDGTDDEAIEAFKNGLSEADYERWKFASWSERMSMPYSEAGTSTLRASGSYAPLHKSIEVDADIAEAIRLSLVEAGSNADQLNHGHGNDDVAEAAVFAAVISGAGTTNHKLAETAGQSESHIHIDEDMAKAIELSFQLNGDVFPYASPWANCERNAGRRRSSLSNTEDYPPLGSMSAGSPSSNRRAMKKGKRKD